MKKTLTIAGVAALIVAAPLAAFATAQPYSVSSEGVTLTSGTFPAHGHVNWRTTRGSGGIHFDPNNNQPGGAYIGKTFLPIPLAEGECITWVQYSETNYHYGENGEELVCRPVATPEPTPTPTPTPAPTETPSPTPEPTESPEPTPSPTPTAEPTPEPSETPKPTPTATVPATTPPVTPEPTSEPTSETPVVDTTPSAEPSEPVTAKRLADTGFDGDTLGNLIAGGLLLAVVGGSLVLWRKGDNA